MISKTLKFKDFDGNEVSQTHYFHLSEPDLIEMETSRDGGLHAYLQRVIEEKNPRHILEMFKWLLLQAYGERRDATHFVKSDEIREWFKSSLAYNSLYMELATDADSGSEFINGLINEEAMATIKALEEA